MFVTYKQIIKQKNYDNLNSPLIKSKFVSEFVGTDKPDKIFQLSVHVSWTLA